MRKALALVGMVAAVAVAPSASGSPNDGTAIRPGVGIGPINLGMTGKEVRRALGTPRTVIERRVIRGVPYTELEYGFGTWSVGLLGRKGKRRVVLVGTSLSGHRTPEGLGVGTYEARLWRELRGRIRERHCHPVTHWYVRDRNRETVFFPTWRRNGPNGWANGEAIVGFVEVRIGPVRACSA